MNEAMTIKGVQFIADSRGKKTGVLIDLKRHRREWEEGLSFNNPLDAIPCTCFARMRVTYPS